MAKKKIRFTNFWGRRDYEAAICGRQNPRALRDGDFLS